MSFGLNGGVLRAFIAGALFVSSFTVATAVIILLILSEQYSVLQIVLFAGMGAVFGDLIIFRFIKNNLIEEITPLYNKVGGRHITAFFQSKYTSWTLPLIGAIIIASPFPDEIGVSLLGISKIKTFHFILISFVLNSIGIFVVISASLALSGQ